MTDAEIDKFTKLREEIEDLRMERMELRLIIAKAMGILEYFKKEGFGAYVQHWLDEANRKLYPEDHTDAQPN